MTRPTASALLAPDRRGAEACARPLVPAPRSSGEGRTPARSGAARERPSWSTPPDPRLSPSGAAREAARESAPEAAPAPAAPAAPRRPADVLLTLLALLGLAVTGLTALAAGSGLSPMVVRSGSMEPTIPTGAVVLVREVPASALRVGDVASVQRPDRTVVTHRVLGTRQERGLVVLTLKGDANPEPDPEPVAVVRAARHVATLPLAGLAATELTSARGGFVLGCLVGLVLRHGRRSAR